jgi:2'-5' RNA ligase
MKNIKINKSCVWIGIGIDIPKGTNLYNECIYINKLLSKKYGNTLLFSEDESVHLNFYDLDIPRNNLNEIKLKLKKIASRIKSFEVSLKSISYFPFGLFYIEVENEDNLSKLHQTIVKTISPLKGNCLCQDYLQPHRKYNQAQKYMLKQHGNPHVLSQFLPHITLGFAKDKNLKSIQDEIKLIFKEDVLKIDNIHIVIGKDEKKEFITLS